MASVAVCADLLKARLKRGHVGGRPGCLVRILDHLCGGGPEARHVLPNTGSRVGLAAGLAVFGKERGEPLHPLGNSRKDLTGFRQIEGSLAANHLRPEPGRGAIRLHEILALRDHIGLSHRTRRDDKT